MDSRHDFAPLSKMVRGDGQSLERRLSIFGRHLIIRCESFAGSQEHLRLLSIADDYCATVICLCSVALEVDGYPSLKCSLKLPPQARNIRASFCPLLSLERGEFIGLLYFSLLSMYDWLILLLIVFAENCMSICLLSVCFSYAFPSHHSRCVSVRQ